MLVDVMEPSSRAFPLNHRQRILKDHVPKPQSMVDMGHECCERLTCMCVDRADMRCACAIFSPCQNCTIRAFDPNLSDLKVKYVALVNEKNSVRV